MLPYLYWGTLYISTSIQLYNYNYDHSQFSWILLKICHSLLSECTHHRVYSMPIYIDVWIAEILLDMVELPKNPIRYNTSSPHTDSNTLLLSLVCLQKNTDKKHRPFCYLLWIAFFSFYRYRSMGLLRSLKPVQFFNGYRYHSMRFQLYCFNINPNSLKFSDLLILLH